MPVGEGTGSETVLEEEAMSYIVAFLVLFEVVVRREK